MYVCVTLCGCVYCCVVMCECVHVVCDVVHFVVCILWCGGVCV